MLRDWKPWGGVVIVSLVIATGVHASDPAGPGPFVAGWRTVTVERPNSSTFSAQLYYPAAGGGGLNAGLDASGGPYAAVSFGHGFLTSVERYHSTFVHLATHGFLVIASQSGMELFPSHSAFAADLSHCLTFLEKETAQAGSFLFGAVDVQAFGISGHSMGGGASILAAASDARIRAVANLAAANTNPSAIARMPDVHVPISLIAGTSDSITPVANHGQLMFDAGNTPMMMPLIQGGWHCGFLDGSFFGCDSGPLARAQQLEVTRRLLTSFFLLHLRQDESMWSLVWGPRAEEDPRVQVLAESGVEVGMGVEAEAFGGRIATARVRVTNTQSEAMQVVIEVEGEWPAQVAPQARLIATPGRPVAAAVHVAVPEGYSAASEGAVVSVRSSENGARGWAEVQVRRLCRADLDRNGILNIDDYTAMVNLYSAGSLDADINNDGVLNIDDLTAFVNAFAQGCE